MTFMLWCTRDRHRAPRVVGLGVEIRGDVQLNNLKPYVRFYLKCQKCGATADVLREAGKTLCTPDGLILSTAHWEDAVTAVPPPDVCCLCNPLFPNGTPRPEIPAAVLRYRLLPTRTDRPACEHVKAALAWPGQAAPCWVSACASHLKAAKDLGRVLGAEALGDAVICVALVDKEVSE